MRRGFGILGLVLTLVIIGVVGAIAYNIGWSDGIGQHLPAATDGAPAANPYYYYGYGPHFFGFGWIFGLFFFLFFLWLIFRVAFGFGRWGRGWGYYRGMGMGPGKHGWGGDIPPAIDERMREWHTRVHSGQSGSDNPPPPPPPPTTA